MIDKNNYLVQFKLNSIVVTNYYLSMNNEHYY